MLNDLFIVGFVVVGMITLVFWRRMNLRYSLAEEAGANDQARYVGPVRLALKRSESLPFLSIQNGINATFLIVGDHTVEVKLRGTAGRIFSRFVLRLGKGAWDASAVAMSIRTVDWNAEPFNRPHRSVVLDVEQGSKHVQLALVPLDADFERIRIALVEAGVRS